jgi:hypothetical protein
MPPWLAVKITFFTSLLKLVSSFLSGVHLALPMPHEHIQEFSKRDVFQKTAARSLLESWCERGNIKINEGKYWAIHFPRSYTGDLTLNGRNAPFINQVKLLGVIFEDKIT